MNYEEIYRRTAKIVTTYRTELESVWPTPPPLDCLKFAVTEAAEVIDAELRNNPMYARNNVKELDPLDEVADCLMMLVSANKQQGYLYVNSGNSGYMFYGTTTLVVECASSLDRFENEGSASIQKPITLCLQMLGEDAPIRVEDRLKRIRAKLTK